ncbi:SH3 domain-containing protein [Streptomyces sp. ID05-04B]|uniref:SH3 domain-containing protein n=1 Tax=Streptomyces sp. ID05-04B TaxID=3028661 RepID=UPI0029C3BB39|nr:SH3 domain-containing protein [Streptomyces sp. ID05-04B]MDX5567361.1 SH3 domain-containing protein [Streptomyces sp. ID05-04B]
MSLRSTLTRLAIVTAAGALAASVAVTPALADGGDGVHARQGGTNDRQHEGGDARQSGGGDGGDDWQAEGGDGDAWQSGDQNGNQSGGNQWQSGGNQSGGSQWQSGGNQSGGSQWQSGGNQSEGSQSGGSQWQSGSHQNDGRRSRGRVTASELLLRSAPTRASQVIRVVHRGDIVSIFCRTSGQNVQGNTHWYLLTDGTWAWGSARYIETIGAAPRWC